MTENPKQPPSRTYNASSFGTMGSTSASSSQVMGGGGIKPGMGIALETPPLPADIEITGPLAASFWVSSESEDIDLFLTLRHFDTDGNELMETGQQGSPVPVAKGWLRVSHRELDPDLSLPYRPYHKHQRRLYLKPGEIVKVDVEIWPTSMVFKKGHRIRLDVQPRDGLGSQGYMHYHADYNTGTNTIHAGGKYESICCCRLFLIINAGQSDARPNGLLASRLTSAAVSESSRNSTLRASEARAADACSSARRKSRVHQAAAQSKTDQRAAADTGRTIGNSDMRLSLRTFREAQC